MLAVERRNLILEKLQDERKVVVSELSVLFGVSEETIRRDLDRLDKEGLATKSYGGALLNENTGLDMPFNVRKKRNIQGKQTIAGLVSQLVRDGEHLMVDSSTTGVAVVKALKNKKRLTVITSSIEVLAELSDVSGWDVICTGGTLMEHYLALVKQAMLKHAKQRILAADHTKFGKVAFSRICTHVDLDIVVTDVCPERKWLDYFAEKGIECLYGGGIDGKEDENHSLCE